MNATTYTNARFENELAYYDANPAAPCDPAISSAFRAYCQTGEQGLGTFMVKDLPSKQDMGQFMDFVENEAGVTEFLLCDRSSGLMEGLHYLLATGWQVCGTYEKQDRYRPLLGLRLRKGEAAE